MKKMTETIYYMVTSSKNKEENTTYMMSSVMETIILRLAVTGEAEMTVVTVTVSTEEILETMIDMVLIFEWKSNRYRIKLHLTRITSANAMCFPITARR